MLSQYYFQGLCVFWRILNANFFASLVGGFLAAYFFWRFFQSKIEELIDYKEKKRISRAFLEELIYNRIIAEKNTKNMQHYLQTKEMNVIEYDTESTAEFIRRKPLDFDDEFYGLIQVFHSAGLKKNNMFLKIFWFSPNKTDADIDVTKKNYLENSKNVLTTIDKILKNPKLIAEMKKVGVIE